MHAHKHIHLHIQHIHTNICMHICKAVMPKVTIEIFSQMKILIHSKCCRWFFVSNSIQFVMSLSFFFIFGFFFCSQKNQIERRRRQPIERTHKIFNQPEILECRRIRSYQCLSIWLIIAYRPTGNFLNSYTHSIFQHQCNWFHIQTVNKNEWKQIDTRRWVHFVCTCTMCAHLHFKRKKKELVKLRHSNRDRENSNSRTAKKKLQLYSLVNYTIIIRCRWNLFLIFFFSLVNHIELTLLILVTLFW